MSSILTRLTRIAKLTYDKKERLLQVEIFPNNEVSFEDSKEFTQITLELTQGDSHIALIKALGNVDISPKARKVGESIPTHLIAQAILVNSVATSIAANFFIKFNKPESPTRVFTNAEEALNWLIFKRNEFDGLVKL